MADTRFSREDYAKAVREATAHINVGAFGKDGERALVPTDRLKLWAAMLSEAASRAPTHRELVDRLRMLEGYEAAEAVAAQRMTPTPEPGAPQQDGPTSQPSAPAEGASGERGKPCAAGRSPCGWLPRSPLPGPACRRWVA